mgnify:CR=1 FL=1
MTGVTIDVRFCLPEPAALGHKVLEIFKSILGIDELHITHRE